jgi:hypothetical protein
MRITETRLSGRLACSYTFILFLIQFSIFANVNSADIDLDVPWCKSLSYDGGGYWTIRVPVEIKNHSSKKLTGDQFRLVIADDNSTSALIGATVASLRVANQDGVEFFFELENPANTRKRTGLLSAGDIITFPVEAEVDSTSILYLYAGNPSAWLPPDIRDFDPGTEYSEHIVNEWLEVTKNNLSLDNKIQINLQAPELLRLSDHKAESSWIAGMQWEYRVPICVQNFGKNNIPAGATTINTKAIQNQLGKLFGFDRKYGFCLIDPSHPGAPLEIAGNIKESIRVIIQIEPLSQKTIWLYISEDHDIKGQSRAVEMFSEIRDHPDLVSRTGNFEPRNEQEWPLAAWAVDPLIKVFRQDLFPEYSSDNIHVFASRNCWKAFQIALRSLTDMEVSVSITALKNIDGKEIPEPKIYQTGYVAVDFPVRYYRTPRISTHTRFYPDHAGSDGWQDFWPDPLIPFENKSSCKLTAQNTQPIWFDIHIPANTPPGIYGGQVIVESNVQKVYLPVEVKVWNLVLPDKRHIPAIYDLRTGPGKNPFGGDMPDEKDWSRFLARYNISPGLLTGAEPRFIYKNGRVQMETKAFDEAVHFLIDELNNTMLYTPGFFYSVGWYSGARPIFDLQPFSPEYVKAWKEAYGMFIDHITGKGWRKNFILYLSDEPRIPIAYQAIAKVSEMAKEVAPDVPVYVSSWDFIEEIEGHITAWGIGAQGQFPLSILEERKKAGDRFIYTTDGQQCLDTPFPATERLMPWFCYRYGVEAFEFWGSSWWTFDPWKYGWHAFYKESGGEQVKNPVRYPNGDGYLAYPGDEIGIHDPVPSIRLIAVREGVDDYEIFHELDKYAANGVRDAIEALDIVRSLVIQPYPGGMISTSFMPDPNAISQARIDAGEILDRLLK